LTGEIRDNPVKPRRNRHGIVQLNKFGGIVARSRLTRYDAIDYISRGLQHFGNDSLFAFLPGNHFAVWQVIAIQPDPHTNFSGRDFNLRQDFPVPIPRVAEVAAFLQHGLLHSLEFGGRCKLLIVRQILARFVRKDRHGPGRHLEHAKAEQKKIREFRA
jgi:hypothetical protein